MTDTIGNRIGKIIESEGIKKVRFAEKLKIDQSYVTQLVNGKRNPSDRTIADICREFNVSEVWLRTGEGQMRINLPEDAEFDLIMTEIQESQDDTIKAILRAYWGLSDAKKAVIRELLVGIIENLGNEKAGK